jgi:hypothetical protein
MGTNNLSAKDQRRIQAERAKALADAEANDERSTMQKKLDRVEAGKKAALAEIEALRRWGR